MSIDVVGLGKVSITLKLEGLDKSQIANIERVEIEVEEPDGKKTIKKGLINKKYGEVYIVLNVIKKGIYKLNAKVYYYDGSWNTSYNTYKFLATTDWND